MRLILRNPIEGLIRLMDESQLIESLIAGEELHVSHLGLAPLNPNCVPPRARHHRDRLARPKVDVSCHDGAGEEGINNHQ
jgi:hypothetical protein